MLNISSLALPRHTVADATRPNAGRVPYLGHGVGLRRQHFGQIDAFRDAIDFVELLTENYLSYGGAPRAALERVAERFPVVLHGVSLSIGSTDPLDSGYLTQLAELARRTGARWVSDHLAYSSAFGVEYHDLLPLPFTEEAVNHVVGRVRAVQARLDVPFALENPSYYIKFPSSAMAEAEFVREVITRADCGLLLDVNNVFVNATNHGYDPRAFIDAMPADRVVQIHMAGHTVLDDGLLIDTHGAPVRAEVLDLYAYTLEHTGPVSTLLEWDHDIPALKVLAAATDELRRISARTLGEVRPWRP